MIIFNIIKKENLQCKQIQLYGELFGGSYNNINQNISIIQKGVNYYSGHDFIAFDLKITCDNGIIYYYNHKDLIELLKMTNIKISPIIKSGTLKEVLKLNPKFESQIYKFYDLNKLENNYAEGVVIKLFEENNVFNKEQENRIIFKYKNPDFSEMIAIVKTNKKENEFIENFKKYVTINRVNNINSKLLENELITCEMLYDDILIDLLKDILSYDDITVNKYKKSCLGFCKGFLLKNKLIIV